MNRHLIVKIQDDIDLIDWVHLGIEFSSWDGVLQLNKTGNEKLNSFPVLFLFYKESQPTLKELDMKEFDLILLEKKINEKYYLETPDVNCSQYALTINDTINCRKLIQIGMIYGEFYNNVVGNIFEGEYKLIFTNIKERERMFSRLKCDKIKLSNPFN